MGAADSKLAFKKGVFRLFEERSIPSAADDYWEQFWTLPECADDVFLLVGSQDIRRVRDEARENLECLIEKILGHLFWLCESPEFLTPQAHALQVLNCVRVLTRIFPFVFESDDFMDWEERYFWTSRTVKRKHPSSIEQLAAPSNRPTTESEVRLTSPSSESEYHRSHPLPKIEFLELEEEPLPSHGQRLIKVLLDLLFTSGFTLPTALETKSRVSYVIWETGVGSSKPIGTSKELDDNRTEILRLLLVLFSRSMYISPIAITSTENRWIDTVMTGSDRQTTLAILCSLINSALKYNPSGWGLPYNHVMFSDQRELLVMLSLQVIVVLLDYQVIERPHNSSGIPPGVCIDDQKRSDAGQWSGDPTDSAGPLEFTSSATSLPPANKNQFQYYLSRLHRDQDFMFLTDGMYRILSNPMAASSTYLPGSTKQVKCHQETLMLCWKTLELNKRFRNYLLETNRVLDIVVILLYFSLEYKQETSHIGLVRMCACILQTLSKDKALGKCLNKPFDGHASLPANVRIPNFHGTYGDYLICSVHHLIATTKRTLRSLYPALISTLSNVSPYIKNLSPLASCRLIQLTTSFASPSFLLTEESNHELLGILLDTLCSILYYQAPENAHLIYALVQYEPKIQTMAQFTLKRGLGDIHKLRYQRAESFNSLRSASESSVPKAADGRPRRPTTSRQQSYHGESSQNHSRRPHLPRRGSSTILEISPIGTSSLSKPAVSSCSTSSSSVSFSRQAKDFQAEERPMVLPVLMRPDSSDSILITPSDGGGHDGDVEDEGGPSTVPKSLKERPVYAMSEKARGKLPEKGHQNQSSLLAREESSCELERDELENGETKRSALHLKSAASNRKPPLLSRASNHRQEQSTTVYDVGQNGFVPTEEWVQSWMKTLRFEPLLVMLRCAIPEIESIHAINDNQVLEYIRINVVPKLQQSLPESGRPPIIIRKFVWGELATWFQGLLWSQIYIGGGGRLGRQGMGAWYETGVKLFSIKTVTPSASAATIVSDNVASVAAAAIRVAGSTFTATSSPTARILSRDHGSSSEASSGTPTAGSSRARSVNQDSSTTNLGTEVSRPPLSTSTSASAVAATNAVVPNSLSVSQE